MNGNVNTLTGNKTSKKLPFGLMLGYATGLIPECLLYNFFYTFFVIYLTNIALLKPMAAGTIALIALIWDCMVYPYIGYRSDISKDKRKYMLNFIPMVLSFVVIFLSVGFSDTGKFIYYLVTAMTFWLFYTLYVIPYYAIIPEITDDYNERTKIRGVSAWFLPICVVIAAGVPMILVEMFSKRGMSTESSWLLTAACIALVAFIFGVITTLSLTRLKPMNKERPEVTGRTNFLIAYWEIGKLKPVKFLAIFAFLFTVVTSLVQGNLLYIILYRLGIDASNMMMAYLALVVAMLVFIPIGVWLAGKTDRKVTIITFFTITIAAMIIFKVVGISSLPILIALQGMIGIAMAAFWALIYPMSYDLVEVDELVNGKRREGAAFALIALCNKLGSAIGLWLIGAILTWVGYDATQAVQAPSTVLGIENISTLVTAGFLFLSLLSIIFYPITKKTFGLVQCELEKKRNGQEYSLKNLKKVV